MNLKSWNKCETIIYQIYILPNNPCQWALCGPWGGRTSLKCCSPIKSQKQTETAGMITFSYICLLETLLPNIGAYRGIWFGAKTNCAFMHTYQSSKYVPFVPVQTGWCYFCLQSTQKLCHYANFAESNDTNVFTRVYILSFSWCWIEQNPLKLCILPMQFIEFNHKVLCP